MFEYFPDSYPWSLTVMIALAMGGEISEIDRACRPLKELAGGPEPAADRAWHASWSNEGRRLVTLAEQDEREGRLWGAARKYLRGATYLLLAERQVAERTPATLRTYCDGLAAFRRGVELDGRPVEFVEVPFEGGALPALFLPAEGDAERAPCMIHFDGLDVMKEIIYLMRLSELPRYGVSVLICDHPGVGEALRLRNMRLTLETERPAAACVDYLEGRGDVDPDRIGIMALSLGGYYAPRAAAFEQRLRACVVWGAIWDLGVLYELAKAPGAAKSVDLESAFASVFGIELDQSEIDRRVRDLTLEPVMHRIECPLLTVHGRNDRQAPVWTAERTHEAAVNSREAVLRIFDESEGGAEHCQADNVTMGTDFMFDWIARALASNYPLRTPEGEVSIGG